jgi:hypothetical protein
MPSSQLDLKRTTIRDKTMADDAPTPPFIYEGVDLVPEEKSTLSEVVDTVKGAAQHVSNAAHRVGDTIEAGKKPGMPLSVIANVAREAPLASLLVAFLLGVAVARPRRR